MMKTVILCGGRGTRLAEETEYKPKPLVEIGGKPILSHIMEIYERQGFNEFILCLGYKGNMIKEYFLHIDEMNNDILLDLNSHQRTNLTKKNALEGKVALIDTGINSMTGARIAKIKKYLAGDEDFFLTYGDGVGNINLKKLYDYHKKMNAIVTITGVKPAHPFGVLQIESNRVKRFDEKPEMKDIISGGFMVCNQKLFDYLSENENCVLEQGPLKELAERGDIAVYEHGGYWSCMDNPKHVNDLNQAYKEAIEKQRKAPWEVIYD